MIASLCRPALSEDAFVTPATAREIAADLVVTEAAVKQHLLRLYTKLRIPEGQNRRIRLANEVIGLGLAKPELPGEQSGARAPVAQVRALATPRPPGLARERAPRDHRPIWRARLSRLCRTSVSIVRMVGKWSSWACRLFTGQYAGAGD